jgi:4-hydroxythreonine-4-phosphate dehydrogenase
MTPLLKSTGSKARIPRILITTGDLDGIGWEITRKALRELQPRLKAQFVVYRGPVKSPNLAGKVATVVSLEEARNLPVKAHSVIEVKSAKPPALWVEEAARACFESEFDALVTAPLSKTAIAKAGLKDIGHTEILSRITRTENLFMGFLGRKFNVVLATGHRPLREAIESLNLATLARATDAAKTILSLLPSKKRKLPIALVGVNPHAGEEGLIGSEEGWMRGFVGERKLSGENLYGPLVPDAAFLPRNWPLFSVYICPYHDQGLIPFKMVHGFTSGVHLTLGLPFVRTSVDHGTAKELFGKNKAEPGSMKDAIRWAVRLSEEKLK